MKSELELLGIDVEFINNYFNDRFFVSVVEDAGMVSEFEMATYDTVEECEEYIDLFYNVFNDYLTDNFWFELKENRDLSLELDDLGWADENVSESRIVLKKGGSL